MPADLVKNVRVKGHCYINAYYESIYLLTCEILTTIYIHIYIYTLHSCDVCEYLSA